MFTVKIADIAIGIENRYSYVYEISKDYLTEDTPVFTVSADSSDIEEEKRLSDVSFAEPLFEATAIYRKIADNLADYDAFVFHGAVVELDGDAYLFTAKSGVGKTTHVKLWLDLFPGRARILNGDKPVIRLINGKPYVSGTPWRGKEGFGYPGLASLSGIAFLERSKENYADAEKPESALIKFATQAHIPRSNSTRSAKALSLFDKILRSVPLVRLRCNMDISAAETAYSAFNESKENN